MVVFFFIIAGFAKGLADRITFHWSTLFPLIKNNPEFWNHQISWRNKWKYGDKANGERFLFSSTLLVAFTDGWHLLQFILINSLICGAVFMNFDLHPFLNFVIARGGFSLGFHLIYR